MSACENKDAFQPLITYASTNQPVQNRNFKDDIEEAAILYNNAKFYYTNNEFSGALVSYSCAAVLLNSIVRQLPQADQQRKASELLNCCLSAVEVLQNKVKSSSSSGSSKDDEKKDWEKICTNLQPLVFSKGSADCLFFSSVAGLRKKRSF